MSTVDGEHKKLWNLRTFTKLNGEKTRVVRLLQAYKRKKLFFSDHKNITRSRLRSLRTLLQSFRDEQNQACDIRKHFGLILREQESCCVVRYTVLCPVKFSFSPLRCAVKMGKNFKDWDCTSKEC